MIVSRTNVNVAQLSILYKCPESGIVQIVDVTIRLPPTEVVSQILVSRV